MYSSYPESRLRKTVGQRSGEWFEVLLMKEDEVVGSIAGLALQKTFGSFPKNKKRGSQFIFCEPLQFSDG